MIKTNNAEADYLLGLLACALNGKPLPTSEGVDFKNLLVLAERQQVYSTVLPVLEDNGILSEDLLLQWKNHKLSELKKTIAVDSERKEICRELDEKKIKYMFLKGLEIRNYYPKTAMRQMSDNDILYDESRRDDLISVMKKRGYYLGASGGISDDFYKKPYCTFEFHRTLFNPEEEFCPEFNPWLNSKEKSEDSSQMVISREDNYLYALGHMYKHYYCIDGCGVRFVCDIFLLSHSDDVLDWNYIDSMLDKFGIKAFHETVLNLAEAIFEDGEMSGDAKKLLDFMFEGGVFGSYKYDIEERIEEYGSKGKFFFRRIFPEKEHMKKEYRVLNGKPYLLPAYYVYRLFEKYAHNRKYMKRDIEALKNIKK